MVEGREEIRYNENREQKYGNKLYMGYWIFALTLKKNEKDK